MRRVLVGQTHASLGTDFGDAIQSLLEILAVGGSQDVGECIGRDGRKGLLGLSVGAPHYHRRGWWRGVRLHEYGRGHGGIAETSVTICEACTDTLAM